MTTAVHIWWRMLCVVAAVNIIAWAVSATALTRHRVHYSAAEYAHRRGLLWLSAGYVAGCAFRSVLPRIDLERICLVASWLSRIVVGRSVATVAELCFMAQCALLLHQLGSDAGHRFIVRISLLLAPLIVVAEGASWYAILSTNYFGHVVENSIWTVCALLLLASFFFLWPHSTGRQRRFLAAMMLFAGSYIVFMTSVDVPMYWSRWHLELTRGVQYLSVFQGLMAASRQCVVNFEWAIWREEIPWMTLYFTVAVWVSLWLPHAPRWSSAAAGPVPTNPAPANPVSTKFEHRTTTN